MKICEGEPTSELDPNKLSVLFAPNNKMVFWLAIVSIAVREVSPELTVKSVVEWEPSERKL